MIADLKPYPALKGSDDLRIGEIPEHWEIEPLCAIAKLKSVKNQYDRELLSVYLNLGVVPFASVKEKRTNVTSEDLSSYQAVDPGDFVLNNQQAWRGSVGVSMHKGIVSPAYLVLSLGPWINPRYANLLLRERSMVAQYLIASKGVGSIQRNLYWPHLKRIPIILPPFPEQAAIVRFLDHADRKIRRYIRAKQTLIKLLEEQKQAIIHRAVTRGLDPSVRLKPSGVEWLGDVPEHWEVKRLRHISPRVGVGLVINPSTYFIDESTPGSVPILLGNNIVPGGFKLDNVRRISPASNKVLRASRLNAGDVIVVRVGAPGVAAVVPAELDECNCASMMIVRRDGSFVSEWMVHAFNSPMLRWQVDLVKYGAAQRQFNISHAVDFWFPVPPRSEQEAIVEHLCSSVALLNQAIRSAECEIELLRDYRTRLIADVVTGKLDVREVAAQLPDEDQELPANDELDDISDPEEDALDDLNQGTEEPEP